MTRRGGIGVHSTTIRFVLLYLTLSVVGTLPVLAFIYHQTNRIVVRSHQSTVEDRTAVLMREYRAGGTAELAREVRERTGAGVLAHGIMLVADRNGRKIAGDLKAWPPSLPGQTKWREMTLYREGRSHPEHFGMSTTHLPTGEHLLIGVVVDDRGRMREALAIALAGAIFLAIPIGLAGGFILLRLVNRRVQAIGDVAARIAAGDLSDRVKLLGTDDPFDRLGISLNAMLARIQALIEELRLVTDALAHDLRSPLMRIRAWIDRAGEEPSGSDERSAIDAISHEIEGMLRMIASSLEISRAEAGMGRENFTTFDLGALTRDLCEMYHPLAEDKGVSIGVDNPREVPFVGNRELIGQAAANLIDNALKYGAEGRSISIGVDEGESGLDFWVADAGTGIPASRRDEALRKYRRLDEARATDGSGLGLALVRAVATLHGGKLFLEDNKPGLRAILRFPRPTGSTEPPAA